MKTIHNSSTETRTSEKLLSRINEDALRDPVDAANDAQALVQLLTSITLLLSDPATRFVLNARIKEDLIGADWNKALHEARTLYNVNKARLNSAFTGGTDAG